MRFRFWSRNGTPIVLWILLSNNYLSRDDRVPVYWMFQFHKPRDQMFVFISESDSNAKNVKVYWLWVQVWTNGTISSLASVSSQYRIQMWTPLCLWANDNWSRMKTSVTMTTSWLSVSDFIHICFRSHSWKASNRWVNNLTLHRNPVSLFRHFVSLAWIRDCWFTISD